MKKVCIQILVFSALNVMISLSSFANKFKLPDPKISYILPMSHPIQLSNTYLLLPEKPEISGGFLIDSYGLNYPAVRLDGKEPKTWQFPHSLNTFFIWNNQLMVNDIKGLIYRFESPNWSLTEFKLKSNSRVQSSVNDLIACTNPVNDKQGDQGKGVCYAIKAGWSVDFNVHFYREAPAICNGHLHLINYKDKTFWIKQIELKQGQVLKQSRYYKPQDKYKNVHKSICDIKF